MSSTSTASVKQNEPEEVIAISDTDDDDKPKVIEKIVARMMKDGKQMFLLKYENSEDCDLISAEEAREKYPQFLIKYFEQRLVIPSKKDILFHKLNQKLKERKQSNNMMNNEN